MNLLIIFWLLDIFNFSFMTMFDTTYPINTGAWCFIWIVAYLLSDSKE